MNIIKLQNELLTKFKDFEVHPDLIEDILNILSKSGNEKAFFSKLIINLKFLKKYGMNAHIQPSNQFELLKDTENMYSMHIKGKTFNIRILYSFLSNGTVLLHGFYERSGKGVTNYSKAIPIAEKRRAEYIESKEEKQ